MYDFAIVGGGIVGLSTGMALYRRFPNAKVVVIEKEAAVANHQTGHNSGVIHSGIYYKPGSFKARFARQGSKSMTEFCRMHGIDHDICGKVIVATKPEDLPLLDDLYLRGLQNELAIQRINVEELKEIEPHVNGLGAIRVPQAGIVNYRQVSEKMADIIRSNGGEIKLNTKVEKIDEDSNEVIIATNNGTIKARIVINCAGLHSDRIAAAAGYKTDMKIVPFRGEYFKLKPEKRFLVNHLIYPVPNPKFPFLGVHFTRMISGEVDAGPNAVLSFKREGYKKTDFNAKDLTEVLSYKGFWKLASKFMKEGMDEYVRSFSKKQFTKSLQELIPEIQEDDLIPAPAGVRAQALQDDGNMVDDFHIIMGKRTIHVCNAPSPAATASIEIGKEVVTRIPEQSHLLEAVLTK
ncbi:MULTISPECIES: L-2-hydroxyglutarate oxidase [unclassified Bacillus (in: firmicutes)]|uniref:L-2-hydroxyglutarate oxidase n=1 Tax=unclassified Bacillus (in: firmicutes) TaxID=185979 RepID=UPI001BE75995|nr:MULTISPECIES: L-2-hydroxyglutarate oxidase [unclassified Bacillus (in: firmicutes)]MBT2616174.1 L-2-hydroxyglutarate oxidase [Bacillus sp. ISL-78]MBT2628950.1 L-2-hydroxyglutarate oxidase [Bacillus sp. ISL-101]MBT2714898.1 L-2-hydroxyglutarate oxidase [Bacillus sp. ISL-57]